MTAQTREAKLEFPDRQLSSEKRLFWAYIVVFLAAWTFRATLLFRIDLMIPSDSWRMVYSNAVKLAIWVVPVFLFLVRRGEKKPFEYLKLTTSIEKRGLFVAAVVTLLYFCVVVAVESATRGKAPATLLAAPASKLISILLFVSISPLLEEILFRGFVLKKLAQWLSFWRANAVSSVLFTSVHWPYWLWSGMAWREIARNTISILMLGMLFGWVVQKTNSLWPGVGAHIANNFLSGLINR
jgi:membrane protease YdiL (CAAX protease family)